jgi:hypothetical protein
MAPKKQNRFATSKDALNSFDKKDSNIFISVSPQYSSSKKRLIFIATLLSLLIITIILFLPSRISDSKQINQANVPLQIDSNSASIIMDSNLGPGKNTAKQEVNKLIQKSPSLNPKTISSIGSTQTAVDSGTVIKTSTPWAKIYVDNKFIGETPFAKPLILAAGKHSVLFVHPSFEPIMQTIIVLPFRSSTVTGNFFDNVGYLNCFATPWAEVYINDQYKDTTPLEKPIMLSPGKYQVRFKNASFQDIVREVAVRSKDTISIVITFKGQ